MGAEVAYPSEEAAGRLPENRLVPSVWRALADPGGRVDVDALRAGCESAVQWWAPLAHLLAFSLGWSDPAGGLKRWADEGLRTDEPRFALIRQLWGDEIGAAVTVVFDPGDPLHLRHSTMGAQAWSPAIAATAPRALPDAPNRRATLVLDRYAGWYAALESAWSDLPPLPNGRSWNIDVIVRPVGWLGSYRRSRQTGLFFAGRHRHHQMGIAR